MRNVELRCEALGSPRPSYTWIDKKGIDASEKEGCFPSICFYK